MCTAVDHGHNSKSVGHIIKQKPQQNALAGVYGTDLYPKACHRQKEVAIIQLSKFVQRAIRPSEHVT